MAIPPLVLRIYADSSGVKKGVTQAQTQIGGLRASVAQNASLIKAGLVGGVVAGMAVSIKAAGDLGEAINATNVTFGNNARVVREWAEGAAESAGLAKAEALQAAAGMGAMFESAGLAGEASARMSVDVSQLAGDIASLRNADPTEMLERMRAGLSGEAEPLRRFGIFISEARVEAEAYRAGIAKVGTELNDAQKIQARYNIILQDSTEAQGDFARTAGSSLPNQLRKLRAQAINLAASFGKILLPAIVLVLRAVNLILGPLAKMIDLLGSIPAPAQEARDALVELGLANDEAAEKVKAVTDAHNEQFRTLAGSARFSGGVTRELDKLVEAETEAQAAANRWAGAGQAAQAQMEGLRRKSFGLGSAFQRFAEVGDEAWTKFTDAATTAVDFVGGAFETLVGKARVTAEQVIRSFRKQAEAALNYEANLQEVARRNIPDVLLQHIVSLGDDGAAILETLANAGDRKFGQMVRAMMRTLRAEQQVEQGIRDLNQVIADLPDFVTIRLNVEGTNAFGGRFGQRQGGGIISAGTPYLVGERGPEIIVPRDSGRVLPAASGAGNQTINVYVGDEQVEHVVVKALNRAAARA